MARQFSISAIISTIDRFTAPVNRMMDAVSRLSNRIRERSQTMTGSFGHLVRAISNASSALSALNRINLSRVQVHIQSITRKVRDLASALIPSKFAVLGGAVAGGVAISAAVKNSAEYESIENRNLGIIKSNPTLKKQYDTLEKQQQVVTKISFNSKEFAKKYSGDDKDWSTIQQIVLQRGRVPENREMMAYASLAANSPHGASTLIDVLRGLYRGEGESAEQAGFAYHTDKGKFFLSMGGEEVNLGNVRDKGYIERLTKSLVYFSEKYLGGLADSQAGTADAQIQGVVSNFSSLIDSMLRGTSWWEQGVKRFLSFTSNLLEVIRPKLTGLSETIFNKISQLFGGLKLSVTDRISSFIDKINQAVSSITLNDIDKFKSQVSDLISGFQEVANAVVGVARTLNSIDHVAQTVVKVANFSPVGYVYDKVFHEKKAPQSIQNTTENTTSLNLTAQQPIISLNIENKSDSPISSNVVTPKSVMFTKPTTKNVGADRRGRR